MGANRFPIARRARPLALPLALGVAPAAWLAAALALSPAFPSRASAREPLRDAPVAWYAEDRGDIPAPKPRDPSLRRDEFDQGFARPAGRFFNPVRIVRHVGGIFGTEIAHSAADINSLDEALNSSWFTNRIGLYPLTAEEVARGPTTVDGPDRSAPWRITRAKTQGITPGFNVKDGRGDTYVIKFDDSCCPGGPSASGVITGRLLYAAGYNVPEDFVVTFRRDELVVGDGVTFTDKLRRRRTMTDADLDTLLEAVNREPDGTYRAIASRYLSGTPIGPFDWKGRRRDDPFDRVKHENRRELRGLRMISAWLAHFDMKQQNTLDMWKDEGGRRYVKHYLIDFASTLGMGAAGPFPLSNFEYGIDHAAIWGRLFALGIHEDAWRRLERPAGLPEVGYFEATYFDPMEWKPLEPNTAFANMTERDGYWAAKIISSFRDDQLRAAVAEGRYHNPEAAAWVLRMLGARRDKIAKYWFDRVAPLDFFRWSGGTLRFHDLGAERGIYPGSTSRYRLRLAACDATRKVDAWGAWLESSEPSFDLAALALTPPGRGAAAGQRPFLAFEVSVARGGAWSRPISVYVARASNRIVALDR